jgi:hypothetical protein
MKKTVLGVIAGALLAFGAFATDVSLRSDHPTEYIVQRGDTLWDIAGRFLEKPWQWPQIWQANPQIANPDLIYPGDRITLAYVDGEPRLLLNRGTGGTVKLGPELRSRPLEAAVPAIPLEEVNAFLTRSRVVASGELDAAPYVVIGAQRHVITGAGDELHARGTFTEGESNYGIYRPGDVFVDPASGEVLGQLAREIGGGRLMSVDGDIGTLLVNRSRSEIRSADRLLPITEQKITATFFPSAPQGEISGEILGVEDGVNQIGRLTVVILNRGERDGLTEGNVLAISKRGEIVRDPVTGEKLQMPDAHGGMLMVFKTFESMSFGLVLEASLSLAVGDLVLNP